MGHQQTTSTIVMKFLLIAVAITAISAQVAEDGSYKTLFADIEEASKVTGSLSGSLTNSAVADVEEASQVTGSLSGSLAATGSLSGSLAATGSLTGSDTNEIQEDSKGD